MDGKVIEVEYVWRQADVRALRRTLWVRSSRVRLWAAAFVVTVVLGVFVQAAFIPIGIVAGGAVLASAIRLIWPWRPLKVEPRIGLRIDDRGIEATRSEGESRTDTLLAWSDVGGFRDLPREVVIVGANEKIGELYVPRRAFDEHPEVLAELRERSEAASRLGDRGEGPGLEDGGDAGAADAVGAQ